MLVRGDEDLLSAGAHSEERHVVHRVDIAHDRASLHRQVGDVVCNVLRGRRRRRLVPLRDDAALVVDDEKS